MTPLELFDYMSGFYERWDIDLARRGLERFCIDPKRLIGRFSGGEQRKLAVAAALAARPELLLLDEPAAGLDPISRRDLLDALIELLGAVEGCTLIISTHLLADLERLADHIAVMKEGKLTLFDSLEEIQRRFRSVQLLFDREPEPDFVIPGLIQVQKNGLVWNCLLECADERVLDHLGSIRGLQVIPKDLSLEELFVRHLGKEV
jgi:ABC-2 type transport system ATP-binding protein